MQGIETGPKAAPFKIFVTERGQHAPELMAAMSLHRIVDNDSNPLRRAEVRQSLVEFYQQLQRTARLMFSITQGDDLLNRSVIQILLKDFETALDIERQFHKEK